MKERRPELCLEAISFLERHRGAGGRGLLRHAQEQRTPRLAVVASAFKDVSHLQCMAVWLTVSTSPETVPKEGKEVAQQISVLCQKQKAFKLVLRALKDRLHIVLDIMYESKGQHVS